MKNSHISLEQRISEDFISKFSPTASISHYSPLASDLAKKCSQVYPMEIGGHYFVKTTNIIEASKARGLQIKTVPMTNDARIGISAEEFNGRQYKAAFAEDLICKHGHAQYTFIVDHATQEPIRKPCCKKCVGGYEAPGELEVEQAKLWLSKEHQTVPTKLQKMQDKVKGTVEIRPSWGAMILAARELGFHTSMGSNGEPRLTRPKEDTQAKASKKVVGQ